MVSFHELFIAFKVDEPSNLNTYPSVLPSDKWNANVYVPAFSGTGYLNERFVRDIPVLSTLIVPLPSALHLSSP